MKFFMCYSGGLDSTVLLYHLMAEGHEVRPVVFDYGQRHYEEVVHAQSTVKALADAGRIPGYNILSLESIFEQITIASKVEGVSAAGALLGVGEVPDGHYTDERMKATIVPNRNMILASIVGGLAVARAYNGLAIGVHAGDHAIYPDCQPDFWAAMGRAFSTGTGLVTLTPFMGMQKHDIVTLGAKYKVPFGETYSCYKGHTLHCGLCGTCTERREAFELAGIRDPTLYADKRTQYTQ